MPTYSGAVLLLILEQTVNNLNQTIKIFVNRSENVIKLLCY